MLNQGINFFTSKASKFAGISIADPVEDKSDWVGQLWPADQCNVHGIDRDPVGKNDNPSWPTCTSSWPYHFGRGIFSPPSPQAVAVPAPLSGGPGPAILNSLGLYLGGNVPHRLGFLGQPIVDCGHEPRRVEIHPPQVMTMDLSPLSFTDAESGPISGQVVAAFGWVNVTVDGTIEFDLWPPARSKASAKFVAKGYANPMSALASGNPQDKSFAWGYTIDNTGPQHGSVPPTLACAPAPGHFPNHVHCVYTDPAGGPRQGIPTDLYGNERMTPHFATSRFDARFFLGWTL
jgi:hypothetical protein